MRKLLACSLLALGLLGWHAARHPARGEADPETKAILSLLNRQVDAWNAGKLPEFMAGYWNDEGLSFYSGKEITRGWKPTLERYQNRYQADGKEMGKLRFHDTEVKLLGGEFALVRSRWELKLKDETPGGLFTLILEKTAAGWRIIHDHTSG